MRTGLKHSVRNNMYGTGFGTTEKINQLCGLRSGDRHKLQRRKKKACHRRRHRSHRRSNGRLQRLERTSGRTLYAELYFFQVPGHSSITTKVVCKLHTNYYDMKIIIPVAMLMFLVLPSQGAFYNEAVQCQAGVYPSTCI